MKNSEAVEVLKITLEEVENELHGLDGSSFVERIESLTNQKEALQLAIEAMSEVEALKHDYARILDLLSESVNGVTPPEEA